MITNYAYFKRLLYGLNANTRMVLGAIPGTKGLRKVVLTVTFTITITSFTINFTISLLGIGFNLTLQVSYE